MPRNKLPKSNRFNPLGLQQKKQLPKSGLDLRSTGKTKTPGARYIKWLPWPRRGTFHFTWKKFFIVLAAVVALFIVAIAAIFAYYVRDLPNPKELSTESTAQSTKIEDRNGNLLYSFYGDKNRTVLASSQISNFSKEATVATEDHGFYQESGFSVRGIARAVYCRIVKNCVAGGGSTITQQYIKNTLLTDSPTLSRKIKELILSVETEQVYSKDEILTGYLNNIPYGGSIYGIEAASQAFFGKDAKDLTLSEAAVIAAIPQRPTYYSPYGDNLDALFARKNLVLDNMVQYGYITKDQANAAKADVPNSTNPTFSAQQGLVAPHFVFYVRQALLNYIGGDPTTAEVKLDQAGYTVKTSLDLDTQNLAQSIVSTMGPTEVKKYNATNASLTAVDPKTGEVLAMVGSIDYSNSKSGNTNFANALLQPGSSFKPFVYATQFDQTHKKFPASITYDLTTDFGNYTPSDYDGKNRGPITDRNALVESLNIPAVKNLYMAGVPDTIATAKSLGISSLNADPSSYGLSLVLGSGEVRPVEMADAYSGFANDGMHMPLRPILTISQNGKVVKDFTTNQGTQAITPEIAYEISSILSDNAARAPIFGTNSPLSIYSRPVAAKSGTTQNFRDGWTVGFTPQISVAVWVGNNDPGKTMTKGSDGSIVAAPIWNAFMQQYLKGKPVVQFDKPADITTVSIDMLSGKLPTAATPANDIISDIFAPWQVPTENDDVHRQVKIDSVTGNLATDLTPAADVILQTYFSVHSEEPDKSNWEQPVQAWAAANGYNTPPPTTSDTVHVAANEPTISITSPTNGGTVNGTVTLTAVPGGTPAISQVQFFVDNASVGTATSSPWSVQYDTSSLTPGSHVIEATVTNEDQLTASAQITVNTSTADTTPPGPVSNASVTKGTAVHSAKLSWTNPSDTDLASVNVYQSSAANQLGTKVKTTPAAPSTQGSVEIDGLAPGMYYFVLRPVDASGNENTSTTQIQFLVTP